MNKEMGNYINRFRVVVIGLSIMITVTAIISIVFPQIIYKNETKKNLELMMSWDYSIILTILPILYICLALIKRYKSVLMIISGILLYILYNYILYGFSLRFNILFLNYTILIGLSFYLFLSTVLYHLRFLKYSISVKDSKVKILIIYLFVMGGLFCIIWLSDLIPSLISGKVPVYAVDLGYITSYIHLIDLALILPLFFISGYLLLKGKSLGEHLGLSSVVFMLCLCISMVSGAIAEIINGYKIDYESLVIFPTLFLFGFYCSCYILEISENEKLVTTYYSEYMVSLHPNWPTANFWYS